MDIDDALATVIASKTKDQKRLSVERIYQKKTQLEHILLRPDTYIGSVEPVTQSMWVWDEGVGMVNREITFVPGLYKIFDEIVVNAADNKQRDPKMSMIKIEIDREKNSISVWNDGKGIPVVEHKVEKLYVPEMIFGHLLTSSNYNDEDKKVTGGRNGYGAKLCNIFSVHFTVETSCKEYNKKFKQSWSNNMGKAHERKIGTATGSDYTKVTFQPDLEKFRMEELDKDIVALLSRRAYDLAGTSSGVKVYLNGERLPVKTFKDYVSMYLKGMQDESGESLKIVYEQINPRWEVCLTSSDKGFQQISFVNSIATTKGGRHVDYVMDQVSKKLAEVVKRKNKGGAEVKSHQIKNFCWLFINCLIENPTFDSQTKENMTLLPKKFGSKCNLPDKFLTSAAKSGIVDYIMNWVRFKAQSDLKKKSAAKSSKLKGIPKLDDANNAGTKHSLNCTLILTEGDSAKTLAISGLSVIGRDNFGVFPLRGKMLNVRDASHKQVMENAEINSIVKIMGFKYSKKYESEEDIKSLRYGKVMIMTDQDHDGSHIKGLLINFIHKNWPEMLRQRVVEEFITPIVKASKGSQILSFYTIPEYEEWQASIGNPKSWKIKYYKGLGTSTSKEAKEYFADMARHRVRFKYSGPEDDGCIDMAFSKSRADDRKDWLTNFMDERRRCREDSRPDPGSDLYIAERRTLSYKDFINKELVMFSCADLERSVPSLVDGLKPGQRKVLYTCFRRNDKREVKVAQLAGSVAELSAYHHGEASLQSTIINMAQNFVGSNNLNLLQPIGQFGTRLYGGKDAASPRYIFTMLSPLARHLFPAVDDCLLSYTYDDNKKVEPIWYCPIIPMVLINGSDGIGTGWATRVPNHDIREVVANCKRMMDGLDPLPMAPKYKNFRGTIEEIESNRFVYSGELAYIDDNTLEITELPIKTWTQTYKENVMEPMLLGSDKTPQSIQEYKEYNTDTTVKFVIKMSPSKRKEAEEKGLHKFFSLQTSLSFSNLLVLFDQFGCLRKFSSTSEILQEFYHLRLKLYGDRKDFLVGMYTAEALKLSNQARFIVEITEGKINISNKPKKSLIKLLQEKKYDSDPVKAWKQTTLQKEVAEDSQDEEAEEDQSFDKNAPDYNYILNMPLWSLTKERKEDLLKQRDIKKNELEVIKMKTSIDLWKEDLDKFLEELDKVEKKEEEDAVVLPPFAKKKGGFGKGRSKTKDGQLEEYKPSPDGIRIEPKIPASLMPKSAAEKRVKKERTLKPTAIKTENTADCFSMDANEPPSLLSRIHNSASKTKPASKKVGSPKRKAPKRNPWESGSDSDASINDFHLNDSESEFAPRKTERRKAPIKKYKESDSFSSDTDDDKKEEQKQSTSKAKKVLKSEDVDEDSVENITSSQSDEDKHIHDWDVAMESQVSNSGVKKIKMVEKRKKPVANKLPEKKPKLATKKRATAQPKVPKKDEKKSKVISDSGDESAQIVSDESDSKIPPKPSQTKKFKQLTLKTLTVNTKKLDLDRDCEQLQDSDRATDKKLAKSNVPVKTKVVAKPKPSKKKKNAWSDSDDDDDDSFLVSKPTSKKTKKEFSDSEDGSCSDAVVVPSRTTSGRRNKPVKYTFSDSDESH